MDGIFHVGCYWDFALVVDIKMKTVFSRQKFHLCVGYFLCCQKPAAEESKIALGWEVEEKGGVWGLGLHPMEVMSPLLPRGVCYRDIAVADESVLTALVLFIAG